MKAKLNYASKYILYYLIFSIFAIVFLQVGINRYKNLHQRKESFQKIEKELVKRYPNWRVYGTFGFRVFFSPSPLSALFYNSSTLKEIQSFVDSGIRLYYHKPETGETVFSNGVMDFSTYLIFFGSIAVLMWGFFIPRNIEKLRFLYSIKPQRFFFRLVISQIALLFMMTGVLFLIVIIFYYLNGVDISKFILYLISFFFVFFLFEVFILLIGITGGALKKFSGIVFLFIMYSLLVLFIPEVVNQSYVSISQNQIKNRYMHELDKAKILMQFEKNSYDELHSKRYNLEEKKNIDKKNSSYYLNNVSKEIEALEKSSIINLKRIIHKYDFFCSFFPPCFFKLVGNEISSLGLHSYLSFRQECKIIQREFLKTYMDKAFNDPYSVVYPFLDNSRNAFQSASRLPLSFIMGLGFIFIYIFLMYLLATKLFYNQLFPVSQNKFQLTINQGTHIFINSNNSDAGGILLSSVIGRNKKGFIKMDDIFAEGLIDLLYLPNPVHINNFALSQGISDCKSVNPSYEEKEKYLLHLVKTLSPKFVIFNSFNSNTMENSHFSSTIAKLKEKDCISVSISNDHLVFPKPDKRYIVRDGFIEY